MPHQSHSALRSGKDHVPQPAGKLFLMQPRMVLDFFNARRHCWLRLISASRNILGILLKSCFQLQSCVLAVRPQCAMAHGVTAPQVQDFSFPLLNLMRFLNFSIVEVPLNSVTSPYYINYLYQFSVVCKPAGGCISPHHSKHK